MVGDDSFVKQKTADNLVDKDFITNASEEDFATSMSQYESTATSKAKVSGKSGSSVSKWKDHL